MNRRDLLKVVLGAPVLAAVHEAPAVQYQPIYWERGANPGEGGMSRGCLNGDCCQGIPDGFLIEITSM